MVVYQAVCHACLIVAGLQFESWLSSAVRGVLVDVPRHVNHACSTSNYKRQTM
jgi:hypothetical protein